MLWHRCLFDHPERERASRVVSHSVIFLCKQNIESDLSIEIDMIYGKLLNPYDNNIIRIILFTLNFVSIGIFQRIIFMLIDGFLVGPWNNVHNALYWYGF